MKIKAPPKQRFRLREFQNHLSTAWRVEGTKRDGTRIRENYSDANDAKCRHIALEAEFMNRDTDTTIQATKLTDAQINLAEMAFAKLEDDADLMRALDHWFKHGKQHAVAESPRLDEAVEKFNAWLDGAKDENGNGICNLRERSRGGLRNMVKIFGNSIPNLRVNDITPEVVEGFLNKQRVSPVTKDNSRRILSRFFSWCIQRPRRWTSINPCREIKIEQGEKAPPDVLPLEDCEALLRSAEKFKGGKLVPYVALCLFSGLRPEETARLTWSGVNLKDREIRLEGWQTKTKRPRVVAICDTLAAWLKAHEGREIYPANWRKDFDAVKAAAGFGGRAEEGEEAEDLKPWPADVMRHTAVSHYFRKTGSYGQTAEQFGNSESIIKNHYQGRVSSDETKKFYALRPTKKGGAK